MSATVDEGDLNRTVPPLPSTQYSPLTGTTKKKLPSSPISGECKSPPPVIQTLRAELLTIVNGVETFITCTPNAREVRLFIHIFF